MKIQANIGALDILGHLIIWVLITIITLGIGAFFFVYSFSKFVINRSVLIDEQGIARKMVCHTNMYGIIGHIIIWIIISIITLGLGFIFYSYKVWNYSLNNTTIESSDNRALSAAF